MIQLTNTVGCVDPHTVCRLLPHAFSISNIFLVFFFLLQNCQMNAIKFQYHANDHPLVSAARFTVVFTAVLVRLHPTRIWNAQTVYKRAHTVRTLLLLGRESADNSRLYSETRGVSPTLLLAVRISAVGLPQHRQ